MARRVRTGRDPCRALNIEDLRQMARRRLPGFAFEYLDGGAEDEWTLRRSRDALDAIHLLPRQLQDVSAVDTRTRMLGGEAALPLVISPTGYNGMLARDGDLALARAAKRAGIPFAQSTMSTSSIEEVSAALDGGRHWFQLYILKDRGFTQSLVERAHGAGCETLIVTTDSQVLGNREWDQRNFARPRVLNWRAKMDTVMHIRWMLDVLIPHGTPRFGNLAEFLPRSEQSARGGAFFIAKQMDAGITWKTLEWVRSQWRGKLVLKGVMREEDAIAAADIGVDGVVISNHGGRQLDGAPGSIEVLPRFTATLRGRCEILIDSGFRRGRDIYKALALGAKGVLCGRALLYGLAAAGERGAHRSLEILASELERTMALMGCSTVDRIDRSGLLAA